MKPKAEKRSAGEETRRLMELLRFLARTLDVSNAALARKAEVPLASLVRYFHGTGEPKVEFLLAVVQALGLEVREFFELAYPSPAAPTAARTKVAKLLNQLQPGSSPELPTVEPKPETPPLTREELQGMLDDLRRELSEILKPK
ncbi:MAG TPA: helix-turn-helix transcriptional regulator [Thermoanaerobaculia bacterium]